MPRSLKPRSTSVEGRLHPSAFNIFLCSPDAGATRPPMHACATCLVMCVMLFPTQTCLQVACEYDSTPFAEQVQGLGQLITAGKIRHWGLSNESTYGLTVFCASADAVGVQRPASVQNVFNLLSRYALLAIDVGDAMHEILALASLAAPPSRILETGTAADQWQVAGPQMPLFVGCHIRKRGSTSEKYGDKCT
jgi:hypothetical protein